MDISWQMFSIVYWWLARVTLVVGFGFLAQNVGPMVGTYECHLLFCECRWGGGCSWRWWGHLNTTHYNQIYWTFCTHRWWGPKNLVQTALTPPHSSHPLAHLTLALTPLVLLCKGGEGTMVQEHKVAKDVRAQGARVRGVQRVWEVQGLKRRQGCEGCKGVRGAKGTRCKGTRGARA